MRYIKDAIKVLGMLDESQISAAAQCLADRVEAGGSLFSFGASHAFIVTEELVYRAGGFMLVNPIYPHGMNFSVKPMTLTSKLERVPGLGRELLANSPAKKGDVLIITSNSGRNAVTIDMALLAKERGITTVAITALSYAGQVASRHPCGKNLPELCDLIIDTKVPFGDAAVEIKGCPQKVGPLSTVAGCAIANELVVQTVELLTKRGIEAPVFLSANLDGGEAYNARLLDKYKDKIHYL